MPVKDIGKTGLLGLCVKCGQAAGRMSHVVNGALMHFSCTPKRAQPRAVLRPIEVTELVW